MAEVVMDVLNTALGTEEDFGSDAPKGARAIEVASNRVQSANARQVFRIFGRPTRTATCDCERPAEPAAPGAVGQQPGATGGRSRSNCKRVRVAHHAS